MPSKVITSKFNVYKTPFPASVLQAGEYILGSSSYNGVLFTKMIGNVEYVYDVEDIKKVNDDFSTYAPIRVPVYTEVQQQYKESEK